MNGTPERAAWPCSCAAAAILAVACGRIAPWDPGHNGELDAASAPEQAPGPPAAPGDGAAPDAGPPVVAELEDDCAFPGTPGEPVLLAAARGVKVAAVDGEHVYFTGGLPPCFQACPPGRPWLRRVPRCGGEVEALVPGIQAPDHVALGGGYVYVRLEDGLQRLRADAPRAGTEVLEGIAPRCLAGMTADARHLYLADACERAVVRVPHGEVRQETIITGLALAEPTRTWTPPVRLAVGAGSLYFRDAVGIHQAELDRWVPRLFHATGLPVSRMVADAGALFLTRGTSEREHVLRVGADRRSRELGRGALGAVESGRVYYLDGADGTVRTVAVNGAGEPEIAVHRAATSVGAHGARLYYTDGDVLLTARREEPRRAGTEDRTPPLWEPRLEGWQAQFRHAASDATGRVTVLGELEGEADLGDGPVEATRAVAVARYDGEGRLEWARIFEESWEAPICTSPPFTYSRFPSPGSSCTPRPEVARCLAIDGAGNIGAVMTEAAGEGDAGAGLVTVLRYLTPGGDPLWSREVPEGEVRCAGAIEGGILVATEGEPGEARVELVAFDPRGDERWRSALGRMREGETFELRDLAAGPAGIAVVGVRTGHVGPDEEDGAAWEQNAGLLVWVRHGGTPAWNRLLDGVDVWGAAVDESGVVLRGDAAAFVDLGRGREAVRWPGPTNTVLARYAADGALERVRFFEGASDPRGPGMLAAHPEGGVVLASHGNMQSTFFFGDPPVPGDLVRGAFVARLHADLTLAWSRRLPADLARPALVAPAPAGGAFAAGRKAGGPYLARLGP